VAAAGATSREDLLRGDHANLAVPREDILQLLGKSASLAPRKGKKKVSATLVSVRVFCTLASKVDEGFDELKAWWAERPGCSTTDLMRAAGHAAKPLLVAPSGEVRVHIGAAGAGGMHGCKLGLVWEGLHNPAPHPGCKLQPSRCRVLFQFHRRCLLPLPLLELQAPLPGVPAPGDAMDDDSDGEESHGVDENTFATAEEEVVSGRRGGHSRPAI
jgi:hypothetical protein